MIANKFKMKLLAIFGF